jgi:hypothetical protein
MKTLLTLTLSTIVTTFGLLACTAATTAIIPPISPSGLVPVKKTMKAFSSDDELAKYFRELAEQVKREANKSATFSVQLPAVLSRRFRRFASGTTARPHKNFNA